MACYIGVAVLLSWTTFVLGYPEFLSQIPNGASVPDPCDPSKIWQGVGHHSPAGGDERNQFGLDFLSNNKVWNAALCQKDSDGDGKTNGEELGDPTCTWTTGATPAGPAKSHPGVCEPLDSDLCKAKNTFITCSAPTTTSSASQGATSHSMSSEKSNSTTFKNNSTTPSNNKSTTPSKSSQKSSTTKSIPSGNVISTTAAKRNASSTVSPHKSDASPAIGLVSEMSISMSPAGENTSHVMPSEKHNSSSTMPSENLAPTAPPDQNTSHIMPSENYNSSSAVSPERSASTTPGFHGASQTFVLLTENTTAPPTTQPVGSGASGRNLNTQFYIGVLGLFLTKCLLRLVH